MEVADFRDLKAPNPDRSSGKLGEGRANQSVFWFHLTKDNLAWIKPEKLLQEHVSRK